jgi:cytochrome b pre-mRNA-processing protein 3
MLGFLFRTLTADPSRGVALFASITKEARQPHWFIEGGVPDSLDGRFAVLASVTALALVRIEQFGEEGNSASVALTERFIEVMEAEHRELGLGDPTLGKTVRKLVGSLSRRVELWRSVVAGDQGWIEAAGESLHKGGARTDALEHSAQAFRHLWKELRQDELAALIAGRLR